MANIKNLTPGKKIPDDFNVIIEIPANSGPVKYEVDKDTGLLAVDRFLPTAMQYPCNYGFIPSTLADDGDPADVLVMTPFKVIPGSLIRCRPLGLLRMKDEAGEDSKIFAVPIEKVCMQYQSIQSLRDISPMLLETISHFFEQYKALEKNKWVKIVGWDDKPAAIQEIMDSVERFSKQHAKV